MELCAAFSITNARECHRAFRRKIIPYLNEENLTMTGDYAASFLPWILIPVVTWLLPVVVMGLLFIHIESDA